MEPGTIGKIKELYKIDLMTAYTVLMAVPVVELFFFAQWQFIQGITLTRLKGYALSDC